MAEDTDDQVDDAEDQLDEDVDAAGDEDDAGVADAENPDAVNGDEDPAQLQAAKKRRAIEARAEERRAENERIARDTAAATARETTRETEAARQRAEDARVEREAVASRTDEQRVQYTLAKKVNQTEQGMTQLSRITQSASDQSRFDRLLNKKPQYEKYADEVERRHQQALQNGGMVPREELLKHLIGENALKDERSARVKGQKEAAGRRVRDARGNGRAARGDQSGSARGTKSVVQRAEEQDWVI